jgi:hypothetical protein
VCSTAGVRWFSRSIPLHSVRLCLPLLIASILLVAGCTGNSNPGLALPEGWVTDDTDRWWKSGADTALVFRDLETLQAMGIQMAPIVYDATVALWGQAPVGEERLIHYVKQSLLPLFRNRPEVVDSLFDELVSPKIRELGSTADPGGAVAKFKRDGYRSIYRHFHEPRTVLRIGQDIMVDIPDSLAGTAAGRTESFQVYISMEGEPIAVELLSGIHPVLDRIALLATLQMRWQPAYLLKGRKSVPLEAWARFRIKFPD